MPIPILFVAKQKYPVYYDKLNDLNYGHFGDIKTAGRGVANFVDYQPWSAGAILS
mgnify:CR=1 FL=1